MKLSCGVLIINEFNEILLGHSTGNKFFDIPKGMCEYGETPLETVIRECLEETSIQLEKNNLKDLGEFKYNKDKNLNLFLCKVKKNDIDINSLVCNSFFENKYTKKMIPEIDYFNWTNISEIKNVCAKNMGNLLDGLMIKINYNTSSKIKKNN